jgi:hypothetical protein
MIYVDNIALLFEDSEGLQLRVVNLVMFCAHTGLQN